ncbi:hypothetical protein ACI6Q2_08025 [Chitinophagaceae bacterium LWZ2-11]
MSSPYQLRESNEYSYQFISDQGIKYQIYFLDYSYMFDDYQEISSPVYTFNIDVVEGNSNNAASDERIVDYFTCI